MRSRTIVTVILTVAAMTILAATPATATASLPDPGQVQSAQLRVAGFDKEVAEANGFKIITKPDGTQASIPVTEAARVEKEAARPGMILMGYTETTDSCGRSYLSAERGSGDTLSLRTGYWVKLKVASREWGVTGFTTWGKWFGVTWQSASTGQGWEGISRQFGINAGGQARINQFSNVKLVDGSICFAATPMTGF